MQGGVGRKRPREGRGREIEECRLVGNMTPHKVRGVACRTHVRRCFHIDLTLLKKKIKRIFFFFFFRFYSWNLDYESMM